jgi:GNAT superfamily N-acetyltransferase
MIREYTNKDFARCVEIINRVWDFDGRFIPSQLSILFKDIYVGGSLSESNFAIVVEENNKVEGFLFGKCGIENLIRNEYSGFFGHLKILYQLLFLNSISLRRKLYYFKIFVAHEKNRKKIEPNRKNEVNLFAVDPNNQGKGYGKILMNYFIEFCKKHNINRVTLDTDKECNYGFYDHFGFKIKGEFYSPLQKEYSGKSGESYVYELKINSTDVAQRQ